MNSQQKVLQLLIENKGHYLSGEEMGQTLGISRAAVWKAINILREKGITIDSRSRVGYAITSEDGNLTDATLALHCQSPKAVDHIHVYPSLASTNTTLKEMALTGAPDGTVVVAKEQTGGRGRMGRSFFSPGGSGIYLSLLYRPDAESNYTSCLTMMACVAIARAIESTVGLFPGIKWVNDLYHNDRKISGILTEASMNVECGGIDHIVLGVGLNLTDPDGGFPEDIQTIAGSLLGHDTVLANTKRLPLIAAILDNLWAIPTSAGFKEYIDDYTSHSIVIGKEVELTAGRQRMSGTVKAFDNLGHLLLTDADGKIHTINSGEISLTLHH